MRVESAAGTNLRCDLGDYPIISEYGFADEPGRWDHWPSGFCTWPNERSASGKIILDRGDIIFPFKDYVRSQIELTVEKAMSQISAAISTPNFSAPTWNSSAIGVYAVSHVGWGLQPKAQWTTLGMYNKEETLGQDGRAFYGNPVLDRPEYGSRWQPQYPCHLDIPMRNCSVYLDEEPMTLKGDVIPPDQKAVA